MRFGTVATLLVGASVLSCMTATVGSASWSAGPGEGHGAGPVLRDPPDRGVRVFGDEVANFAGTYVSVSETGVPDGRASLTVTFEGGRRLVAIMVGEGHATRLIDGTVGSEPTVDTYTANWTSASGSAQSERRRVESSLLHSGTKVVASERVLAWPVSYRIWQDWELRKAQRVSLDLKDGYLAVEETGLAFSVQDERTMKRFAKVR
jgi:hypothetical protein